MFAFAAKEHSPCESCSCLGQCLWQLLDPCWPQGQKSELNKAEESMELEAAKMVWEWGGELTGIPGLRISLKFKAENLYSFRNHTAKWRGLKKTKKWLILVASTSEVEFECLVDPSVLIQQSWNVSWKCHFSDLNGKDKTFCRHGVC